MVSPRSHRDHGVDGDWLMAYGFLHYHRSSVLAIHYLPLAIRFETPCLSFLCGGMKVLVLNEGSRLIAGKVTRPFKLCRGFAPGGRLLAEETTCILCFSTRRRNGDAGDGFSSL